MSLRAGIPFGQKTGERSAARRSVWLFALWSAPLAFLALFYFYPLASILRLSFARVLEGAANPLVQALTSAGLRGVIWFTFWQAAVSTLLTLLVGLPGAFLLARYEFRGKALFQALAGIPFVLPTLVVAAAFNALIGPRGLANQALMEIFNLSAPPVQLSHSLSAILIAHVFYNTTIVLRMVGDFWSHLDPRLFQAARTLGANPWDALRRVTLPLLLPAIAAAGLLIFVFDFTSFGVILVLGGPRFATIEVEIFTQTYSLFNLPLAAALAIIQLIITLALSVIYTRLTERLSRPMNLRPQRYTRTRLTSWKSRLFAALTVVLLLLFLTSPLVALATRSISSYEPDQADQTSGEWRFTLDYYRQLSTNPRGSLFFVPPSTAIRISLMYALATVVLALGLGLPAAWALAREREAALTRWLDPILMLPLGTSAVTLGLGFIVALNRSPLDLRASPILVPIAHTLVAFPFVVRSLTPALRSIQPRLRQAAAILGASPMQVFRSIDLPLIGRALFVAATFAFTISLGEFGATTVIARPEYPTMPLAIYRFLTLPGSLNFGQALALSTIMMAVTAGGMLAIERFRIADVGEF